VGSEVLEAVVFLFTAHSSQLTAHSSRGEDAIRGGENPQQRFEDALGYESAAAVVRHPAQRGAGEPTQTGTARFELLDEIEEKLSIKVRPLSWPIGMGKTFKGVYSLYEKSLHLFVSSKTKVEEGIQITDLNDTAIDEYIGESYARQLRADAELVEGVYPEFDVKSYLAGDVAPVFFGSAVNNFGVKELLDTFIRIAPTPVPRETTVRIVVPEENKFSGFVFKIHANMDPKHRNRIAFLRICSGQFERGSNCHCGGSATRHVPRRAHQ
jgi:peptide subunit release factor RF-3